jgi:4-hydroxybenzoate polyprenyltransferase
MNELDEANRATRGVLANYLDLIRYRQWIKNLLLFIALAFGKKLSDMEAVFHACLGFGAFCLLSSGVYVLNDILDRHEDRLHPTKSRRPIAAGITPVGSAAVLAAAMILVALVGAAFLDRLFLGCALSYLALQFAYSGLLKQKPIVDVMCIALGFVIRAVAGAVLVHVVISPWLIVCTFTLCLFIGFGKRRCEIAMLADSGNAAEHRPALAHYTQDLLNHLITVSAGIAIISFLSYVMHPQTTEKYGTDYLVYTLPLVVYGVFRYAMLAERGQATGPTEIFLSDKPSQLTAIAWMLSATLIIYYGVEIREWLAPTVQAL